MKSNRGRYAERAAGRSEPRNAAPRRWHRRRRAGILPPHVHSPRARERQEPDGVPAKGTLSDGGGLRAEGPDL